MRIRLRPPLLRYLARAGPPYSQAHQPVSSACPPRPLSPGPRAARLCRSAWAPSARAGPSVPAAFGPGASFGSDSAQGLQAATRPLPAGIPRPSPRLGPPWPFLPVGHSSLHRLLTRSGLPSPARALPPFRPIRVASGVPCPARQSVPALKQFGTRGPGRQCAPLSPGSSDRPRRRKPSASSPAPRSPIRWAALAHQPSLRSVGTPGLSSRHRRPGASVRLGGPGPGLLALGRASQPRPPPPSGRAIPARRFGIRYSPARPRLERQFGAHSWPVTPTPVVPALPARPQTGPPGLAPRAPPARPRCRSTCRFGPCLYSAQSAQSRNSCSDTTVRLPVTRAGPCPRPPGLAPRAPRPLGRLRSLPEVAPHPATYPTPRSPEPPYGRSPPARTARTGRGERWGPRPSSSLAPPPGTWPPWSLPPLPHRTSNSGRARPRAPPSWGGARAREWHPWTAILKRSAVRTVSSAMWGRLRTALKEHRINPHSSQVS